MGARLVSAGWPLTCWIIHSQNMKIEYKIEFSYWNDDSGKDEKIEDSFIVEAENRVDIYQEGRRRFEKAHPKTCSYRADNYLAHYIREYDD